MSELEEEYLEARGKPRAQRGRKPKKMTYADVQDVDPCSLFDEGCVQMVQFEDEREVLSEVTWNCRTAAVYLE